MKKMLSIIFFFLWMVMSEKTFITVGLLLKQYLNSNMFATHDICNALQPGWDNAYIWFSLETIWIWSKKLIIYAGKIIFSSKKV